MFFTLLGITLSLAAAPKVPVADIQLPNRAVRLQALERADLLEEVREMDELDQDLFYLRARKQSQERLQALYPNFPKAKLLKLQSVEWRASEWQASEREAAERQKEAQ